MKVTLMMEATRTSETSVYDSKTTRPYIPECSHLHLSLFPPTFSVVCALMPPHMIFDHPGLCSFVSVADRNLHIGRQQPVDEISILSL
jgi:hypothetical protein